MCRTTRHTTRKVATKGIEEKASAVKDAERETPGTWSVQASSSHLSDGSIEAFGRGQVEAQDHIVVGDREFRDLRNLGLR